MRRLGAALGVEAMSLYRYVPTKAALLDGMVERMLEELRVPADGLDPARWREEARASLERLRDIALAHPRAFPLVATRAVASYVAGREVAEAYLRMLVEAGFSPETAATAQRALLRYAIGFALGDIAAEPGAAPAPGGGPVDATIAEVAAGRSDAAFAFGLELMLSGLEDVLARERRGGAGA
jgi:TetR/AcrR family transcriptional regulator, tetracycline repressor protein